ncbi:MAG: hypothetical protein WBW71_05715 [Bacteroidota bacterium]
MQGEEENRLEVCDDAVLLEMLPNAGVFREGHGVEFIIPPARESIFVFDKYC